MKLEWKETPPPGPGQMSGYKAEWKEWRFDAWPSNQSNTSNLLITLGWETIYGRYNYESIEEAKADAILALGAWLLSRLDDIEEESVDGKQVEEEEKE